MHCRRPFNFRKIHKQKENFPTDVATWLNTSLCKPILNDYHCKHRNAWQTVVCNEKGNGNEKRNGTIAKVGRNGIFPKYLCTPLHLELLTSERCVWWVEQLAVSDSVSSTLSPHDLDAPASTWSSQRSQSCVIWELRKMCHYPYNFWLQCGSKYYQHQHLQLISNHTYSTSPVMLLICTALIFVSNLLYHLEKWFSHCDALRIDFVSSWVQSHLRCVTICPVQFRPKKNSENIHWATWMQPHSYIQYSFFFWERFPHHRLSFLAIHCRKLE